MLVHASYFNFVQHFSLQKNGKSFSLILSLKNHIFFTFSLNKTTVFQWVKTILLFSRLADGIRKFHLSSKRGLKTSVRRS